MGLSLVPTEEASPPNVGIPGFPCLCGAGLLPVGTARGTGPCPYRRQPPGFMISRTQERQTHGPDHESAGPTPLGLTRMLSPP